MNLVGHSSAAVRNIPRATFERWNMLLRQNNLSKEQCLLLLIEAYVKEHWNQELERQFRDIYGLEEGDETIKV